MSKENSSKWLFIAAVAVLMIAFQGTALAGNDSPPDRRQIEADLSMATQLEQAYQRDSQALAQAYRSGADRQTIQNLQTAVTNDIGRLRTNAQDLAKDGVSNPNPVHSDNVQDYNESYNGNGNNRRSRRLSFQDMDWNGDGGISSDEWRTNSDKVFENYDQNGNGVLTRDEINAGPQWRQNDNRWNNSQQDPFSGMDRNNDGTISRDEWRGKSRSFERLDQYHDGKLTRDEFSNPQQTAAAVFYEIDFNNDGLVSRNEWSNAFNDSASFNKLDVNQDGVLSENEFNSVQTAATTTATTSTGTSTSASTSDLLGQLFQQILSKNKE